MVQGQSQRPHIIFILADDWGYNDVGYHNPDIITPNIDQLTSSGIRLEQNYVHYFCTPSRSALLTGMYPYHIGRQTSVLYGDSPTGLTLNRTLLSNALKDIGYHTHMIGKWHLGHCNEAYLPLHRGFDSHLGYWVGLQYYYNKSYYGYDFHDGDQLVTDPLAKEIYSDFIYTEKIVNDLVNHAFMHPTEPLFYYVSIQNPHYPLEAPPEYEALYPNIDDPYRKTYSAIVTALDDVVGNITQTLKSTGLYDNSIIVMLGDNGAKIGTGGGSNLPLKGFKGTIYEGGTRTPGYSSNKMIHVVDWLPTLLHAAQAPNHIFQKFSDIDGLDQYEVLFNNAPAVRDRFVYNLEESEGENGTSSHGAVRVQDYKLIVNADYDYRDLLGEYYDVHYDDFDEVEGSGRREGSYQLYNLAQDPNEVFDLSEDMPEKVEELLVYYHDMIATIVPNDDQPGAGFNYTLDEDDNMITNWCQV